jgi:hypothetical protein
MQGCPNGRHGLDPTSKGAHMAKEIRERLRHLTTMRSEGRSQLEDTQCGPGPTAKLPPFDIDETAAKLHLIVTHYLDDAADLHRLVDQAVAEGVKGLALLANDSKVGHSDEKCLASLEAIVRVDGTRPSFLVREGTVDLASSPVGTWYPTLVASEDSLAHLFSCVGRINDPRAAQGFRGTGFLIHEDLVLTNRHVLQVIADPRPDGTWTVHQDVAIDFGHEFKGQESINRRVITAVAYAPAKPITGNPIDHNKLDIAVVRLGRATPKTKPRNILVIELNTEWPTTNAFVFTAGYPARPPFHAYDESLLERIFKSTYGFKRVAPGAILSDRPSHWTISHDATTLGGNSGSPVVVVGRETIVAAVHYGGRSSEARENWAHACSSAMQAPEKNSSQTLQSVLERYGVGLVNTAAQT